MDSRRYMVRGSEGNNRSIVKEQAKRKGGGYVNETWLKKREGKIIDEGLKDE